MSKYEKLCLYNHRTGLHFKIRRIGAKEAQTVLLTGGANHSLVTGHKRGQVRTLSVSACASPKQNDALGVPTYTGAGAMLIIAASLKQNDACFHNMSISWLRNPQCLDPRYRLLLLQAMMKPGGLRLLLFKVVFGIYFTPAGVAEGEEAKEPMDGNAETIATTFPLLSEAGEAVPSCIS
eukprot:1152131-Pelagomonas_calceolata.AAC.2